MREHVLFTMKQLSILKAFIPVHYSNYRTLLLKPKVQPSPAGTEQWDFLKTSRLYAVNRKLLTYFGQVLARFSALTG